MIQLKTIGEKIASALLVRLGTGVAVWLIASGVPQSLVEQFFAAVIAVLGIAFDMLIAAVRNRVETR